VERLFNQKLSQGRVVAENAFGILKQAFSELKNFSDFHVTLVPDVVLCCVLLHNILLRQSIEEVDRLFKCLQHEGMVPFVDDDPEVDDQTGGQPMADFVRREDKRREINTFLAFQ
jgi:phospholipid N-methyltransferase